MVMSWSNKTNTKNHGGCNWYVQNKQHEHVLSPQIR